MKYKVSILLCFIFFIFNITYINTNAIFALANPQQTLEETKEDPMESYGSKVKKFLNSLLNEKNNFKFVSPFNSRFFTNYMKSSSNIIAPEKPKSSLNSYLKYTTNYDLKKAVQDGKDEWSFTNIQVWGSSIGENGLFKSQNISDFMDMWENGFVVPGLDYCANGCNDMVPQGICVAEDYLFITEYCNCDSDHDSVICILEKETGAYIKTVIMYNLHPHVGGITYYDDGSGHQYIIVTGYAKDKNDGLSTILRYDYFDFINAKDGSYITNYLDVTVETDNASFTTYNKFHGKLYVGYCATDDDKGKFYTVPIVNGTFNSDAGKTYSNYVNRMQGCEFVSEDTALIVTSYGKANSMLFFNSIDGDGKISTSYKDYIVAPPYMEEIAIDFKTGKMYCIFESGTSTYEDRTAMSIDRVVVLDFLEYLKKYD